MAASGLVAPKAFSEPNSAYRTVQTVPISGGSLEIVEDARLTPALARKLWGSAVDPVLVLGDDSPAAQPFKSKPLVAARLRQRDGVGHVVLDVVPDEEAPLARIERRRLGTGLTPVYLVTTDNDAGFGSYSGRATALYAFRNGRFEPVQATDVDGKTVPVSLANTLKSAWRITDARASHTVIRQVLCRPDLSHIGPGQDAEFLVTYVTYQFNGQDWWMAKRVTKGFWEADQDWPSSSEFPRTNPSQILQRPPSGHGRS